MAKEQINYDINADISKSISQAAEYEAVLNRIEKQWDKINKQSNEAGGTVTYRQTTQGHRLNSEATALSRGLEDSIQQLSKQVLAAKRNGNDDDYVRLTSTLQRLTGVLASNQSRSGIETFGQGDAAQTSLERFLREKERTGSVTGIPSGVRRGATTEEQLDLKAQQASVTQVTARYKKAVTAIEANQRKLDRNYSTSSATGQMSYSGNRRFQADYQNNSVNVAQTSSDIAQNIKQWDSRSNKLIQQRNTLQEKQRSDANTPEQVNAYQKQIAQLNSQISVYTENIRLLRLFNERLNTVGKKQEQVKTNYDTEVQSGNIQVQRDPSSFAGIMYNRRMAIGGIVASSLINSYTNSIDSGTVLRRNSYNTYGDAYTAQGKTNQFDIDSFQTIREGTQRGFSGKDTAQFADTYTSYLGTKGAVQGTGYLEDWARYGGLGTDTANQLGRTLEQQGVTTNPQDIKRIAEAFTGSLKDSGLSGQAKVQGQALNSILSNLSGQRLSTQEVNGTSNLLNKLGQDPRFRGEAGANAMNSLQNVFSNGMNSRLLTAAYTNGNPKYFGARGQARLQESMTNIFAHPEDTQNALRYILRTAPNGDIQTAAARLSTESGGQMTVAQAKKWLSLAKSGDLVKTMRQDNSKKGRQQLQQAQQNFGQSGISSVMQQQGYADQGNYAASQSMDNVRQTTNSLKSHPILNALTSGTGSLIQQAVGIGLGIGGFPTLMRGIGGIFGKGATTAATSTAAEAATGAATGAATSTATEAATGAATRAATTGATTAGATAAGTTVGATAATAGETAATGGLRGVLGGMGLASLSSLAVPAAGVAGGIGAVRSVGDMASGNTERQNTGLGTFGLIGTGLTAGALLGGVPGAIAGAGVGALGSMVPGLSKSLGSKGRYLYNGVTAPFRATRAKAATNDQTSNANTAWQSSWIKGNQGLITGYNKVLDRMIKTADILKKALSTPVGSGDSDKSGDEDVTSGDMEANAKSINNYLKKNVPGSTPEARAALLGNLQHESGLDPKAVEVGGGGHGLAQWTGARFTNLQNFAKSKGKSWDDLGVQLDYMLNGDGSDSEVIKRLLKSKGSVGSLTSQIESQWERAGVSALGQRQGYAQNWYNKLPKHAAGAIVDKPEVSVIGEKGAEAVIPLTDRSRGLSVLSQAAGYLGMTPVSASSETGTRGKMTVSPVFNISVKSNGDETLEALQKAGSQAVDSISQILNNKLGYYSNEVIRG